VEAKTANMEKASKQRFISLSLRRIDNMPDLPLEIGALRSARLIKPLFSTLEKKSPQVSFD
jgi:hypothetical protein